VARLGETRYAFTILARKPLGKWSLGRQRSWYDNTKADPGKMDCDSKRLRSVQWLT
jgi:hypothetical protein